MSRLTRRQAANMLGVSLPMMTRFEKNGDLKGKRDDQGRVSYDRSSVEDLRAARADQSNKPELVLDVDEKGAFYLKEPENVDPAEEFRERRWKREMDVREKELMLKERELLLKQRIVEMVGKNLPKFVSAVERGSWANVGGSIVAAIPEDHRTKILQELVSMFKKD